MSHGERCRTSVVRRIEGSRYGAGIDRPWGRCGACARRDAMRRADAVPIWFVFKRRRQGLLDIAVMQAWVCASSS